MTITRTIIEQLGGSRFVAMTGASFVCDDDARRVHVHLPRKAARGISSVMVRLGADDTYTAIFYKYNARRLELMEVATVHGIYTDRLRHVFTLYTGLETSL